VPHVYVLLLFIVVVFLAVALAAANSRSSLDRGLDRSLDPGRATVDMSNYAVDQGFSAAPAQNDAALTA
jgi:hypothetical protein